MRLSRPASSWMIWAARRAAERRLCRIEDGQLPSLPRAEGQAVRIPIEEFHQKFPGLRPLFQLSFAFMGQPAATTSPMRSA